MWEKIKAFLSNTIVKIVSWIVLALDVIGLTIGGATETEISSGVTLTLGIVGTVAAFIAFVSERLKKK